VCVCHLCACGRVCLKSVKIRKWLASYESLCVDVCVGACVWVRGACDSPQAGFEVMLGVYVNGTDVVCICV